MNCPFCNGQMVSQETTEKENFKSKDILITYPVWKCSDCGKELVETQELEKVWTAQWDRHEKEHGIPDPKELKLSRERLGLTGEELAAVLGKTKSLISKLESGSRRLSDNLLKVYQDYIIPGPHKFSELLDISRLNGITTDKIYKDLKEKITDNSGESIRKKEIIILEEYGREPSIFNGYNLFSANFFLSIIAFIMREKIEIDTMDLFKIIFYVDAEYFTHFSKSLLGIRYLRNEWGPTPFDYSLILSLLEESNILTSSDKESFWKINNIDFQYRLNLDTSVIKFIENVLNIYDEKKKDLSNLSHTEPAWLDTPPKKIIPFYKGMIISRLAI